MSNFSIHTIMPEFLYSRPMLTTGWLDAIVCYIEPEIIIEMKARDYEFPLIEYRHTVDMNVSTDDNGRFRYELSIEVDTNHFIYLLLRSYMETAAALLSRSPAAMFVRVEGKHRPF